MKTKNVIILSFLIGLGIRTQIYLWGCIGVSELIVFFCVPFILFKDMRKLFHDGFRTVICLFLLCAVGVVLSSFVNNSKPVATYKFIAALYSCFCALIVFHRFLTVTPYCIGYYVLGLAFSSIISVWFLHPQDSLHVANDIYADISLEEQMSGVLFWVHKLRDLLIVPVCLAYLKIPIAYSVIMPIGFAAFSLLTSISGRSAAVGMIGLSALALLGQKKRYYMRKISKHFLIFAVIACSVLFAFKSIYSYSAKHGYLGDGARNKYYNQTEQGEGVLNILMGGRAEFFVAMEACLDHPILGLGPDAEDTRGYWSRFLERYGNTKYFDYYRRTIMGRRMEYVAAHSHLTIFWLSCGILGLFFELYVLWLMFGYFRKWIGTIPQLYGYFAILIPQIFWDIFFTPFTRRFDVGVLLAGLLVSKAIFEGKMKLPIGAELEAQKIDNM